MTRLQIGRPLSGSRKPMSEEPVTCRYVTDRLSDFLEGHLDPRIQQRVEEHLNSCPTCRRTLDELRLTISLLQRLNPQRPVPPDKA